MNKIAKLFVITVLVIMAQSPLTSYAQRCAVLEFKAGVGVSQSDVDGISAIFITYFRPAGYTMVERTQIDKVIEEQRFQRSNMTQSQMVRLGQILNVSKIVVGDVNVVFGQYQVDVRAINVETGTIAATEGATFATTSYRSSMQSVAQKLANKIAITPSSSIPAKPQSSTTPKQRSSVEILYGYLKIFPKELGTFSSEPINVISQINAQAQYGYNNWRIPTNEELSLLRANNYLGSGEYMTREKKNGIVLLVTDGKDYTTVQAEEREQERQRMEEQERQRAEEQERQKAEEQKQRQKQYEALKAQGYVDLGLPSGTIWKDNNESGYFTYYEALNKFGSKLPTKEQWGEMVQYCTWTWTGSGYRVTGPNGQSTFLPADGCIHNGMKWLEECDYWSRTPNNDADVSSAWNLGAHSKFYSESYYREVTDKISVRLIRW